MRKGRLIRLVFFIGAAPGFLVGCNLIGPRTIRGARFNYNEAIARSAEEQLLLNLVRLRYGHAPFFLQVSSVTTQYEFDVSARWQRIIGFENTSDEETTLGAGVAYAERPTVTYIPLQGEQLARQLLKPLSLETLFLLAEAGWESDAVFRACVSRIGEYRNVPGQSTKFDALVELLNSSAGRAEISIESLDERGVVRAELSREAREDPRVRELIEGLGVDPDTRSLSIVPYLSRRPGEIGVALRSPLAIMRVFSLHVDAPEKDVIDGVVVRRGGDRDPRNPVFRAHTSESRPPVAAVLVNYDGEWFFIRRDDARSKSALAMLSHLLSLQSTSESLLGPLQTLQVGK